MARKLALKRLTASDLTFFEWHYHNFPAGNQKAINLNAEILVERLFPALEVVARTTGGRFPIDLVVYGPGLQPLHNLQRKVIKGRTYKNWRLDGEFIHNPDESPERFNVLREGDFAVFEFIGDVSPDAAIAVFVAKNDPDDADLHAFLERTYRAASMTALAAPDISQAIVNGRVSPNHPLNELALDSALEDASQNGLTGTATLLRRRSGRRVSAAQLAEARGAAERVGQAGEEFVYGYLQLLSEQGAVQGCEWASQENALSPYDFEVVEQGGLEVLVEVKATSGEFDRRLHISAAELDAMAQSAQRYDIYRVFEVKENLARMRIATDVRGWAQTIVAALRGLPTGVLTDGVSVEPRVLPFGSAVSLDRSKFPGAEAGQE